MTTSLAPGGSNLLPNLALFPLLSQASCDQTQCNSYCPRPPGIRRFFFLSAGPWRIRLLVVSAGLVRPGGGEGGFDDVPLPKKKKQRQRLFLSACLP